jgi:hypothetical protein
LGYFVGTGVVMAKLGWPNLDHGAGPFLRPDFAPRLTTFSKLNFSEPNKRDSRESLLRLPQIGDESFCVCAELVDGFCGGNVEGSIIAIAPSEIGRLLGHDNSA